MYRSRRELFPSASTPPLLIPIANPNPQSSPMPRRATTATIEPKQGRRAHFGRARGELARFESVVGELSAAMARVPADSVDREIDTWLGKICRTLDLDRSGIYERDTPSEPVRTTHTWLRPNFPPFPRSWDPGKFMQTTTDWVMAGNQVVFSRPAEIPAELQDGRNFAQR